MHRFVDTISWDVFLTIPFYKFHIARYLQRAAVNKYGSLESSSRARIRISANADVSHYEVSHFICIEGSFGNLDNRDWSITLSIKDVVA